MWFLIMPLLAYAGFNADFVYSHLLESVSFLDSTGLINSLNFLIRFRILIIALGIILPLIGLAALFSKANRPFWYAFIPGFNVYQLYKISEFPQLLFIQLAIISALIFIPMGHALVLLLSIAYLFF